MNIHEHINRAAGKDITGPNLAVQSRQGLIFIGVLILALITTLLSHTAQAATGLSEPLFGFVKEQSPFSPMAAQVAIFSSASSSVC